MVESLVTDLCYQSPEIWIQIIIYPQEKIDKINIKQKLIQ